jgi:hypothetical protein
MFDYLTKRYQKEYNDCAATDATLKGAHGVPLLTLGTLRMFARDLIFDDLEDVNGISKATNRLNAGSGTCSKVQSPLKVLYP